MWVRRLVGGVRKETGYSAVCFTDGRSNLLSRGPGTMTSEALRKILVAGAAVAALSFTAACKPKTDADAASSEAAAAASAATDASVAAASAADAASSAASDASAAAMSAASAAPAKP
jgi:hypothetical protein